MDLNLKEYYKNCIYSLIQKFEHLKDKIINVQIKFGYEYVCGIQWVIHDYFICIIIHICNGFDTFPNFVRDFIFSHELGHLEYAVINKIYTTDQCCIQDGITNSSGLFMGLIATLFYSNNMKKLPFIIPCLYTSYCLFFLYQQRKLEYDADKKACKALKSNKGAIQYFKYGISINNTFVNFLKSSYKTHPCYMLRIRNIKNDF